MNKKFMGIVPDINALENDAKDVSEARIKLDDLLNEIVDRNDDGNSTDEEVCKKIPGNIQVHTPTKRTFSGRAPRRKKRKDPYEEGFSSDKPSYVIKVFDRRVNLAKFNSQSTLYVMLREWMKNKPYSSPELDDVPNTMLDNEDGILLRDTDGVSSRENRIYQLPMPVKIEEDVPGSSSLPAVQTSSIEDMIDTKEDITELQKINMLRWRQVKNKSKEQSFRNQQRYLESIRLLKSTMVNPSTTLSK